MSVAQGVKIPAGMVSSALGDAYYTQGNATMRVIQALVQPNVISMALATPPGSPTNGDTYIVAGSPTGAWTGKAKYVAYWSADVNVTAAWDFHAPVSGWIVANQADGVVYRYNGSAWIPLISAVPSVNTQTASYTLVLGDAGGFVRMNSGSANNLTVPLNSGVAFPVGTVVTVRQIGAGATTIVATGGVTINNPGSTLVLRKQLATVQLVKVGADEWDLIGDITGA